MQVGSQHVVCIITDSAPVNRAAAKEGGQESWLNLEGGGEEEQERGKY